MRAAGLATMAYYYFNFHDVKKQDRYGLLPFSFPNYPILVPMFYPGCIQAMLVEQENPLLARSKGV
jgi:hypothetical protein